MITRKRDGEGHRVELHVADVPADAPDESIAAWLAAAEHVPSAPERVPADGFWPTPGRSEVRPHREFCDDDELTVWLLSMEREAQAAADQMAAENDARMKRLSDWSATAVRRSAEAWMAFVFRWRRMQIAELVPALGHLLAAGDVDPGTAAGIVGLRSRYLSSPDESQRLPRLTPELLAELDAKRGVAA